MSSGDQDTDSVRQHDTPTPQDQVDVVMVGAGAAVVLLLLLLLVWWWCSWRRHPAGVRGRAVLLLGPSDAGKTLLFSQLAHKRQVETYTSMKENIAPSLVVSVANEEAAAGETRSVNVGSLVDIPGQERLRYALFDRYKLSAKAIVYVMDASTVQKSLVDTSEFLFRILSDEAVHRSGVPIAVVCNKQDLPQAKSAALIERELGKEINVLRNSAHNDRFVMADASSQRCFLGKSGHDFQFSHLPNPVDFFEVSTSSGCTDAESGFDALFTWLAKL